MGAVLSDSKSTHQSIMSKKKPKKPWYKNKSTRISILLAVTVVSLVVVFVASLEIRMKAPVIIMTAHDYPNVIAFNANTGAFITTQLLDLSYQKHLDLASYVKDEKIQFRSMVQKDNEIVVTNGQTKSSFIASFICNDAASGWKLDNYFPFQNDTDTMEFIDHPYGLTWDSKHKWWIFTTQSTSSLFIYDEKGKAVTNLNGMRQHFPGAVFTLINQTNGIYLDTFMPNIKAFQDETKGEKKWDLKSKASSYGIRGVAVDIEYGLIFIAVEIFGKILVYDIDKNFTNTYNITICDNPKDCEPVSVLNGDPYFPLTLFITERKNSNGIFAVRYSKHGYSMWWQTTSFEQLQHATGIAVSADSLFVLSQGKHSILRYSPYNGKYLGRVVHFENSVPSGIISHKGIGKVGNPVESRTTLGEQLLYIPSGACAVM